MNLYPYQDHFSKLASRLSVGWQATKVHPNYQKYPPN